MFRRLVGAVVVLAFAVGITLAAEISGVIVKVEGDKVTFAEMKGKEKGAEKTLPIADNVKVFKGKFNKDTKKIEVGDALTGGLKNEAFSKISEKGLRAVIVTDADSKKITEIRVLAAKKKADQ